MKELDSRRNTSERLKSTERFRLVEARAIAIFGEEGSGKSNLSTPLAKILNARILQGGREIRSALGGNHATVGYLERDLSVDQDFDKYQLAKMSEASAKDPLINESRLSGYMATRIMRENPDIKIIRINVTCPKRERIRRIRKRSLDAWKEKKGVLLNQLSANEISSEEFEQKAFALEKERGDISFDEILKKETERRRKDNVQWGNVWPELAGKDILNPGARIKGEKIYDLTVSTGKRTKKQTFEYVLGWLKENGFVEKM